ncbi:MAG TPA: hypothetical protein VGX28_15825 [Frankiaceae bacterium]|jgi:hypothetical protein|nr:hypothetical protein [Frankiaceae bacterium]
MSGLRRTVLLAVAAASASPLSAGAAPATSATVGVPCAYTGATVPSGRIETVSVSVSTGQLTCLPWAEVTGTTSASRSLLAARSCGTVQVNDAVAAGPAPGSASTCGSATGSGPVSVSSVPGDRLYVCTYAVTTSGGVRTYDADGDASNGAQCALVLDAGTGTGGGQGGVCLAARPPIVVDDPREPDPFCAACLSGIDPWVDDLYETVLEVVHL